MNRIVLVMLMVPHLLSSNDHVEQNGADPREEDQQEECLECIDYSAKKAYEDAQLDEALNEIYCLLCHIMALEKNMNDLESRIEKLEKKVR